MKMGLSTFFHATTNMGEFLSLTSRSCFINQQQPVLRSTSNGCWHGVPSDILNAIGGKLCLSDRIRLSSVCRLWRSSLDRLKSEAELPWLILPQDLKSSKLQCLNVSQGNIQNLNVPKQLQGGWFCGSSNGWLVFAKDRDCFLRHILAGAFGAIYSLITAYRDGQPPFLSDYNSFLLKTISLGIGLYLYNPNSGEIVQLPPISSNPCFLHWDKREEWDPLSICKIAVSSSTVNSECIVAVVFCEYLELGVCKPGDNKWTIFQGDYDNEGDYMNTITRYLDDELQETDFQFFQDILFHDGELLVLRSVAPTSRFPSVENFNLILGQDNLNLKCIPNAFHVDIPEDMKNDFILNDDDEDYQNHLVMSVKGDLLLIYRMINKLRHDLDYGITRRFHIFKLDLHTNSFTYIRRLDDEVIFVGSTGSRAICGRNYDGEILRNCIYFADSKPYYENDHDAQEDIPYFSLESGVYHLSDGKIERCFPSVALPMLFMLTWFTPIH